MNNPPDGELFILARPTGLEPAIFSVTGRRIKPLSHGRTKPMLNMIHETDIISNRHARCYFAVVAQLVEQLIRNEQVAGSTPVNGSIGSS